MTIERRKNPRFIVEGDYYYYPGIAGKHFKYSLRNVSVTGACIWTGEKLSDGDVILLHFMGPREAVLKSRVVWGSNNNYGLVFFLDTSEDFDTISYVMNNAVYSGG